MEKVQTLFSNSTFLTIVGIISTIIGGIIPIFIGNRLTHKKMKYRVAKKENSTIIAFWNASARVIEKKDLYFMRLQCTKDATVKTVYTSDEDVNLEIKSSPKRSRDVDCERGEQLEQNENYDLSFDFLVSRQGYVIRIDDTGNYPTILTARLYSENRSEFSRFSPLDLMSITDIMPRLLAIVYINMAIIMGASVKGYLVDLVLTIPVGFFFIVYLSFILMMAILFILMELRTSFLTPRVINKEFSKLIQEEKYTEEKKQFKEFVAILSPSIKTFGIK